MFDLFLNGPRRGTDTEHRNWGNVHRILLRWRRASRLKTTPGEGYFKALFRTLWLPCPTLCSGVMRKVNETVHFFHTCHRNILNRIQDKLPELGLSGGTFEGRVFVLAVERQLRLGSD